MDKRLELVSFPPPHKVLVTKHQPHIPPVARVGERQDLPRMHGCGAEQRFRIGIAANDPVENRNVRRRHRFRNLREISAEKLNGARAVARLDLVLANFQKRGRSFNNRRGSSFARAEFHRYRRDAGANVQQMFSRKRLPEQFRGKQLRDPRRAPAPVVAQIPLCPLPPKMRFHAATERHFPLSVPPNGALCVKLLLLPGASSADNSQGKPRVNLVRTSSHRVPLCCKSNVQETKGSRMLQMTHCPNSGLHMRKEEREAALPFRFMKHSFSVPLLLSFAFFL